MNFEITRCSSEEADFIDDKIVEFNLQKVPADCENNRIVYWFGKKMTDENGRIVAGCLAARTVWGTAEVSVLWVDEAYRKQGLGTQLLADVEKDFRENGCNIVLLDTFDWQARGFYEKQGYSVSAPLRIARKAIADTT
jgi:ribosomal protein S18 acetylase RimI-like enzyme